MSKSKQNILEESVEEVVNEAWGGGGSTFGGAPGGGSGSFRWNSKGGAETRQSGHKSTTPGSPPYRGMTGSPGGINIQDIAQESEEFAKEAGKNKPFPLDLVNEHLVEAFIRLANAEIQLKSACKYNKVLTKDKEKKAVLEHCYKKVKVIREMIKSVSQDFDRITLS